jgi:hypothetical protein
MRRIGVNINMNPHKGRCEGVIRIDLTQNKVQW